MSIKFLEVPKEKKVWKSDHRDKRQSRTIKIPPSFPQNSSYTNKNIINPPEMPCIVCYMELAAGVYTDCQHKVVCLGCAQNHFLNAIHENQRPRCLVASCRAPFLESSISIFHQFSQKTKQKWRTEEKVEYLRKNSESHQIFRACQFPNCEGFVSPKTRTCVVCSHLHCQLCSRLQHHGFCKTMTVIDGPIEVKHCKFCNGKIYKQGGCSKLKCLTCRRLICYQCGEQWSYKHHGCASGGWFKLPYFYFLQNCCDDNSVNKKDEILI